MAKVTLEGDFGEARLTDRYQVAQEWLTNEVARDCEPYVPFAKSTRTHKGGTLNASVRVDTKKGLVSWNTPYARKQYYELPRKNPSKHPKATWKWFEAAKAVRLSNWMRGIAKLIGENK